MSDKTNWIFGNDPTCDVVIDRPSVSWRHCKLTRRADGSYALDDLKSSNGTYVNGRRVVGSVPVRRVDAITLGTAVSLPWPAEAVDPPKQASLAVASLSRIIRIGRDVENDYLIDRPEISSHHARISIAPGGLEGLVEDLGSTNGVAVNHPENRVKIAPIRPADVLFFGPIRIPASTFFPSSSASVADAIPELVIRDARITVGRDRSCDLVVDFPMISGRHARVERVHGTMLLEDLGSANGTFVNGKPVRRPTAVQSGDLVGLGGFTLVVVDGSAPLGRATPPSDPIVLGPDVHQPTPSTNAHTPSGLEPLLSQSSTIPLLATIGLMVALALTLALAIRFGASPDPATTLFLLNLASVVTGLAIPFAAYFSRLVRDHPRPRPAPALAFAFALGLPLAALPLLLLAPRVSFENRLPSAIGLLWLTNMLGSAAGIAFQRFAPRPRHALAAAVVLGLAMSVLGGPWRPLPALPTPARHIASLLPTRWSYEALLTVAARNPRPAPDLERLFPARSDRAGLLACTTALLTTLVGLISLNLLVPASRYQPLRKPSRRRF